MRLRNTDTADLERRRAALYAELADIDHELQRRHREWTHQMQQEKQAWLNRKPSTHPLGGWESILS